MSKFVLIDDDQAFGLIMSKAASKRGLELDVFLSLGDMASIGALGMYDAAIVDYELGGMTGVEIGEYLSSLFTHIPMILISYQDRPKNVHWPDSIKAFLHKGQGYEQIFNELEKLRLNLAS